MGVVCPGRRLDRRRADAAGGAAGGVPAPRADSRLRGQRVSQIGRNTSCPCESGRKYKRCCGAARPEIDPGALSRGDMAVGDRIQEWAYTKHPDEMDAALGERVGDPHGVVCGDTDTQLVASWQLNDRELAGGGTPAQRYARLPRLTDSERAIARRIASARLALLRVRSTEPGRAIAIEDVTRGSGRARVVSHEVSSYVRTNDMFVGHLCRGRRRRRCGDRWRCWTVVPGVS